MAKIGKLTVYTSGGKPLECGILKGFSQTLDVFTGPATALVQKPFPVKHFKFYIFNYKRPSHRFFMWISFSFCA